MKKSIVSKLAVVCLTAVVAIGGVSMPASAKSKGYVFKYKGVSVTMNGAAKKLIKKAGKPSKKTVKKSCAYKGKDRTYTYKDFQLKTYSKTNNGAEYGSDKRRDPHWQFSERCHQKVRKSKGKIRRVYV